MTLSEKPSLQSQMIFWGVIALVIFGFLTLFASVVLPFILGIAIAYLLNPLIDGLAKIKIPRTASSAVILVAFFTVVFGVIAVITPILGRELATLSKSIPDYFKTLSDILEPHIQALQTFIPGEDKPLPNFETIDTKGMFEKLMGSVNRETFKNGAFVMSKGLQTILGGGAAIGSFFTTLVLAPIVAFFMMRDWKRVQNWCTELMPHDHKPTILGLIKEIDGKISGFVRGQITVALVLAFLYAIALTIAGLKYGFLIGFAAGLLSIIPMLGSVVGFIVSLGVAWFQSGGDWSFLALIGGIFIVGQLIEGNILTPKLVGESVGLHPLWVFFAVMAGGALLGVLGMFLAVPVAAVTGVLIAFAISRYKSSDLYKSKKPATPKATKKKAPAKKSAPKKAVPKKTKK
jgi:predicted PurR-regulated permease PerM